MRYLVLVIVVFTLAANSFARKASKKVQTNFTNFYTGQNTNVRSLLNIDGYFKMTEVGHFESGYGKVRTVTDSLHYYFILYDDGTFLYNVTDGGMGFSKYFQYLSENNRRLEYIGNWGIYRIEGDSLIIAQLIDNRKRDWKMREIRFSIADKNTLIYRQQSDLLHHSKQDLFNLKQAESNANRLPVKFFPCDVMPPPKSWLKNENWIWCH